MMKKKVDILFVCGAGLGSSFAAQMAAEDVLNAKGVQAKLDHVDISTAASMKPDIIITAQNFKTQTKIVYLKNIVSKAEIEEKLVPVLIEKGAI